MPYKNNDYKNFIRSARWQRIRAYHFQRNPLCARCASQGKVTVAERGAPHHHLPGRPSLQMEPGNLESLCSHHASPIAG